MSAATPRIYQSDQVDKIWSEEQIVRLLAKAVVPTGFRHSSRKLPF